MLDRYLNFISSIILKFICLLFTFSSYFWSFLYFMLTEIGILFNFHFSQSLLFSFLTVNDLMELVLSIEMEFLLAFGINYYHLSQTIAFKVIFALWF